MSRYQRLAPAVARVKSGQSGQSFPAPQGTFWVFVPTPGARLSKRIRLGAKDEWFAQGRGGR